MDELTKASLFWILLNMLELFYCLFVTYIIQFTDLNEHFNSNPMRVILLNIEYDREI